MTVHVIQLVKDIYIGWLPLFPSLLKTVFKFRPLDKSLSIQCISAQKLFILEREKRIHKLKAQTT